MPDSTKSYQRLLAELKRRKVFRVMAVYGATAFVLLQAADLLAEGMGLSEQLLRITTFLVLIGFPIAVVLAWAFETTPDGVRRTEGAAPEEIAAIVAQPARGRWSSGLLALAGVALLFGGWWMGRQTGADRVTDAPPTHSLAVLPFLDLSESGDQAWFSDGITEEILNSLAALPELMVTARTSSFQFRGQERDIKEIADTLGVAHVLEGSVRRIDDQLAVTAQLIRAADGNHLWSETYERSADDLFEVQQDVAERVASALDVYLDDEKREAMFASGTRNVEAFEAYQRGREQYLIWHADMSGTQAANLGQAEFKRAMTLDPRFAEAAIQHMDAYAHVLMDGLDIGLSQDEAMAGLRRDLEFASTNALNPSIRLVAELNAELFSPDWFRMPELLAQLRTRPVGELHSVVWLASLLTIADRQTGRRVAEAFAETDPLSPWPWYRLANLRLAEGDLDGARAHVAEGRRRAGQHFTFARFDWVADARSDSALARRMLEESRQEEEWPDEYRLVLYHEIGDDARTAALARRIDQLPGGSVIFIRLLERTGFVPFNLADTPNFARRLQQAGIDLSGFGVRR